MDIAAQFVVDCLAELQNNEALRSRVRATLDDADDPVPWYRLANYCRRRGRLDLWRIGVRAALDRQHVTHEQLFRRGTVRIMLGDWGGWLDLDHHLASPQHRIAPSYQYLEWSAVRWAQHEDLTSKSLFIIEEQGHGDMIQFMRFVPVLAERADRVVAILPPTLFGLYRHNLDDTIALCSTADELVRTVDRYAWMMSLPGLVGRLVPFVPLMAPNPTSPIAGAADSLHVGLCWAGNPAHQNDQNRSMPFSACQSLFHKPGISWHNLYVGPRASETAECRALLPAAIPLATFTDTANVIAGLDCVVSVDTAVCHLAGSLGTPTFLLLPYAAEWRWGLEESTPWYPSMRIIRQPAPGDWGGVVQRLTEQLDPLLS